MMHKAYFSSVSPYRSAADIIPARAAHMRAQAAELMDRIERIQRRQQKEGPASVASAGTSASTSGAGEDPA
jgi:hypothetical protein